jgi:hypothetical protein
MGGGNGGGGGNGDGDGDGAFRPCVVIPTYDNPITIAGVVAQARAHVPDVLIVDDGSGEEGRRAIDAIVTAGHARVPGASATAARGRR